MIAARQPERHRAARCRPHVRDPASGASSRAEPVDEVRAMKRILLFINGPLTVPTRPSTPFGSPAPLAGARTPPSGSSSWAMQSLRHSRSGDPEWLLHARSNVEGHSRATAARLPTPAGGATWAAARWGLLRARIGSAPPSGESEDPICSLPQARQSSIFLFQKG